MTVIIIVTVRFMRILSPRTKGFGCYRLCTEVRVRGKLRWKTCWRDPDTSFTLDVGCSTLIRHECKGMERGQLCVVGAAVKEYVVNTDDSLWYRKAGCDDPILHGPPCSPQSTPHGQGASAIPPTTTRALILEYMSSGHGRK